MRKINEFFKSVNNYLIGFGFFPDHHIWNLKVALCYFLVPRLRAFQKKVLDDNFYAIPVWVEKKPIEVGNLSEEDIKNLNKKWAKILEEILFPFEYEIEPMKFEKLPSNEIDIRTKKGLEYFAKYFCHFWD